MMRLCRGIILAVMFVNSAYADEEEPSQDRVMMNYVSIEGGGALYDKLNKPDYDHKKPKNSSIFGVGLGRNINEYVAVEADVYRFQEFKFDHSFDELRVQQKFSAINFGVNVKFTAPEIIPGIYPFANVGVGYASINTGTLETSSVGNPAEYKEGMTPGNVSFNAGAGIKVPLVDNLLLRLSYQFFDLGKSSTSAIKSIGGSTVGYSYPVKTSIRVHTGLVALQYNF